MSGAEAAGGRQLSLGLPVVYAVQVYEPGEGWRDWRGRMPPIPTRQLADAQADLLARVSPTRQFRVIEREGASGGDG